MYRSSFFHATGRSDKSWVTRVTANPFSTYATVRQLHVLRLKWWKLLNFYLDFFWKYSGKWSICSWSKCTIFQNILDWFSGKWNICSFVGSLMLEWIQTVTLLICVKVRLRTSKAPFYRSFWIDNTSKMWQNVPQSGNGLWERSKFYSKVDPTTNLFILQFMLSIGKPLIGGTLDPDNHIKEEFVMFLFC